MLLLAHLVGPELHPLVRVVDSRKELFCPTTGVPYRALSQDAGTVHGLSPQFVGRHSPVPGLDGEVAHSTLYGTSVSGCLPRFNLELPRHI
jgi:hypothetical protein